MKKRVAYFMGVAFIIGTFLVAESRIEAGVGIIIAILFFILSEVSREDE